MIHPMLTRDADRGRRSAFAAATFSALLPGLGHAYLRRWGRGLVWMAPYVLLGALLAGILVDPAVRNDFLARFAAPSWLLGAMVAIAIDALYRALSAIDAWRLANSAEGTAGAPALRVGSVGGLLGVVLVLAISHVAVARFPLLAYEALIGIGGGDEAPIVPRPSSAPTLSPRPSAGAPTASPGTSPTAAPPTATLPSPVTPGATIGPDAAWNGRDRLNILLIGADRREDGGVTYLTDTLIVATIDPVTRQIGMISLPRDTTQVPFPPSWEGVTSLYGTTYAGKINALYTEARNRGDPFTGSDAQRGYIAIKGALSELYQLDIQYYLAVDLGGFVSVIDTLGGVIIDVQTPVTDPHYPSDDGRAGLKLYVPAGIGYMDGAETLAYARARHETSDFDRAERQQRVIASVRAQTDLARLLEPGVLQGLLETFSEDVDTDIPPELFPQLLTLAQGIDLNERVSLVLAAPTYSTVCYPCPGSGLYELQANVPAIREAVAGIFTTTAEAAQRRQRLASEAGVVHVLNGTPAANTAAARISEALARMGIDATVPPIAGGRADRPTYTSTVVTVYNGREAALPETVAFLQETFAVTVQTETDPTRTADIVVIVGSATQPIDGDGGSAVPPAQ